MTNNLKQRCSIYGLEQEMLIVRGCGPEFDRHSTAEIAAGAAAAAAGVGAMSALVYRKGCLK